MEVTLLTRDQMLGDNALQVVKDYDNRTGLSDLAIVLGGCIDGYTFEGDPCGYIWSSSQAINERIQALGPLGNMCFCNSDVRYNAVCPALPPSTTRLISPSVTRASSLKLNNGKSLNIVEYGEYPQTVAAQNCQCDLEILYNKNALTKTGKEYTFDAVKIDGYGTPFQPKKHPEYTFNGERYIRVEGRPFGGNSQLSNGERVMADKPYWIKVEPIVWRQDPTGAWVSKKALIAGITFDDPNYYTGDFAKTNMKDYLDTYFSKEMQPLANQLINERKAKEDVLAEAKERLMKNKGKYKDRVSGVVVADRIAEGRRPVRGKRLINKEVTPEVGKELVADIETQVLQEIKVHSQRLC